ncbi:hypothetical protein [Streptomyces sp. NPDC003393]
MEPIPDALTRIEEVVGPARRHIAEVPSRYTPEQRNLLFDYFEHAAPAFRAATEEIRKTMAARSKRTARAEDGC